jgi:DNA topoisomerase-3
MPVLLLAEKPSQAFDYAKGIGNCKKKEGYIDCGDILITWALGHLFEIDDSIAPQKWSLETLPIFPSNFKLRLRRGAKRQFEVIKKLLKRVDEVWIGGDPGREGELIAREILKMAGWRDWSRVKRIWTSEALTPEVVRKALKNLKPASEFDGLYYSALARQHSDWIVGINLTRLVSLKAGDRSVWSVGRVQTPALKLLVDRENEIKNFKPTPYWVIKARFEKGDKTFWGVLVLPDKTEGVSKRETNSEGGEEKQTPGVIRDKELALRVFKEVEGVPYGVVERVERKLKKEPPPLLHSLTSIQREANRLFGFSAEKTLKLAQRLYEEHKVISYPRTDSRYLANSNRKLVKEILKKLGKEELIPRVDKAGKRVFDDARLTDHHAIIPLDRAQKKLTEDERRIYDLILRRFLGAFMPPHEYEITEATLKVGKYPFLARGKRDISPGWRILYTEISEEKQPLPPLKEGEEVKKTETLLEERKTQPPPRYTEGELLKKMEKLNLGTPATRAQIIETLKKRGYISTKGKALVPTEKAFSLLNLLEGSKVASPELTAEWEKKLEGIYLKGLNERGYKTFLEEIKRFTKSEIENLKSAQGVELKAPKTATPKMLKLALALAKELGLKLPKEKTFEEIGGFIKNALEKKKEGLGSCRCGGKIVPFPKGWRCEGCGAVVWNFFMGKRITARQAVRLLQGKEVLLRGLKSKNGRSFNAKVKLEGGRLKITSFVD